MQNYRYGEQIVIGNHKLHIIKLLGQGSFGSVYQVCDYVNQQNIYALKIQDGMSDQESEITQIIRNKNPKGIVKIYEFIKQNNSYLILMEYLPHNLYEIITNQVITEPQLRYIFKQLAETVQSLHDLNIAHRDLKPENILVENIGSQRNQLTFKLCDFGISKIETQELFKTINIGTPYYQAPEQLDNNVCFNKSVDIWALGAIYYEMITRKPLFNGTSIQQVQSLIKNREHSRSQINKLSIHQDFKDLILKMVEFDAAKRITLDQLIQNLKPRVEKSPIIIPQQIQTLQKPSSQRNQNITQPFNNDFAQKNDKINNQEKMQVPQKVVGLYANQVQNNIIPSGFKSVQPFVGLKANGNKIGQNYFQKADQQNHENYHEEKQSIHNGKNQSVVIPLSNPQNIQYLPSQNIQTVQSNQQQKQPSNHNHQTNPKSLLVNDQQSGQEQAKQSTNAQESNLPKKSLSPPQKQTNIKPINDQMKRFLSPQQDQTKQADYNKIYPNNKKQQLNAESPIGDRQSRMHLFQQDSLKKINFQQVQEQNVPKIKDIQQENSGIQEQVQQVQQVQQAQQVQQVPQIIFQSQHQNSSQNQTQPIQPIKTIQPNQHIQPIQIQQIKSNNHPTNQESYKDQKHIENNNIIGNINNHIPQAALKQPQRIGQSQPPVNNQLINIQYPINSEKQQNIQTIQNQLPKQQNYAIPIIGNNQAIGQQIPSSQGKNIVNQSNVGQVQQIANLLPAPPISNISKDIKPMDSKSIQIDRPNSQNQSNKIQFQQNIQPFVRGGIPQLKKG